MLRAGRHGMIEVVDERLVAIRIKRLPFWATMLDVCWWGPRHHARQSGNRCRLYYTQPRSCPNFLALRYVLSDRGTSVATGRGALCVLDEIARIKGTAAIVCDVANARISDRLLARWGWEPHTRSRWHRNHIKRFYGTYPAPDPLLISLLARPADARNPMPAPDPPLSGTIGIAQPTASR
jgi:hypothetical protein